MNFRKHLTAIAVASAITAPMSAHATNGYFSHGYGTSLKGMAGAGVALSKDSLAAATNPAAMVNVGNRMDFGAGLFRPFREYDTTDASGMGFFIPHDEESSQTGFLIPHFGYNRMIDNNRSFGVSVYANGGMNTDYGSDVQFGFGTFYGGAIPGGNAGTGVNLAQLFIAPTYSAKISDKTSWGISAMLAYQRFSAKGLDLFGGFVADGNPDDLTSNGDDNSYGIGAKIGIMHEVQPGLTLGASYQSRTYMSEFDDYSDLFAEQGDFDIPATATIGLAYKPNKDVTIAFDIQKIWYSDIDAIANPISNLTDGCFFGDFSQCLGGDNGAGFGWDDMTIYKLGVEWVAGNGWTWRAGYSHGEQPIPGSEAMFNILAPAVVEDHITLGFTKDISANNQLTFAFMYALNNDLDGNAPLAFGGDPIELSMDQYELELSYSWRF